MPLPAPNQGESQDSYVARCMSGDGAVEEFPDNEQRMAVCSSLYESAQKRVGDLTAPIALKDEENRIVYGPVLIPDVIDSDGDTVSADKIERVAHKFMEEYRLMEHMHTLRAVARPVESYITPTALKLGETDVPKGSWVVGAKIQDDAAWDEVKTGRLTGFSIVAIPAGALKSDSVVTKLTLRQIEESGRDWEVIAIGLVDEPAVPLAKWTAIKSAEPTALDKFKAWITSKDVKDLIESAEAEESQKQKSHHERSGEVDEKEVAKLIGTAVSEALTPLTERLDTLEESGKAAAEKSKEEKKKDAKTVSLTAEEIAEAVENASKDAAKEAVAEVIVKFEEHIENLPKASAKSLAESLRGQDGHSEKSGSAMKRDAFGRRVREEVKS